ncbi:proteasome regulatory particle subunit [Moniliophthora roreri]|nr:proteasome regulatory particle subunit [Moniliophthora roreri]
MPPQSGGWPGALRDFQECDFISDDGYVNSTNQCDIQLLERSVVTSRPWGMPTIMHLFWTT